MFEWIKNHKVYSAMIILFLFLFFIIIIPLILNQIYYSETPFDLFVVGYDVSNILEYYGAVLTFIGTVSLGIITVYQNHISQEKTDEVNRLTLELQRKSMLLAEQNYKSNKLQEENKNIPKFELRNTHSNGRYLNLGSILKNVSNIIVSGIKTISFEVLDVSGDVVSTSNKVKTKQYSLSPGSETQVEFHNSEIKSTTTKSVGGQQVYESLKNFNIVWRFQCEDINSNMHYYKAKLHVEDSEKFTGEIWKVKKVG